jgi:hypothetical protein
VAKTRGPDGRHLVSAWGLEMSPPILTMREALSRPEYFGAQLGAASWAKWRALLLAICGETLEPGELVDFKELTNRQTAPTEPVREFHGVIGRRGGKTRSMSVLAAYIAACRDHRSVLAPGERGEVLILAQTKDQAQRSFNFVTGAFGASKALRGLVETQTADTLCLASGVDIVVRPASFRSTRGGTSIAIVCDEIAFWRSDESANPDEEILRALRPSLLTTKGPLISISSPYSRKGELWKAYSKHFGKNSRVLVAQAASWVINPVVDMAYIDEQTADDPIASSAEYGANFRTDLESFISREAVDAIVMRGRFELAPVSNVRYVGFADPAGGGPDSFTMAIAHREGNTAVLDVVRGRRGSPEDAVAEYAALLKQYRISKVQGDNYAKDWPVEAFKRRGIAYIKSDKVRSEIYLAALPLINSGRVELLDNQTLITQLLCLERKTATSGRDTINHAAKAHDDLINSAAGALVNAVSRPPPMVISDEVLRRCAIPMPRAAGGRMKCFF